MLANLMNVAGVNHVITIDLHASQMQGFFKCPVDNLVAEPILAKWIKMNVHEWADAVVVSKNPGGTKRVTSLADALKLSFGIVTTDRKRPHGNSSMNNSAIFETLGTDGTTDRRTLEDEMAETQIYSSREAQRVTSAPAEHDWAHQRSGSRVNGSYSDSSTQRNSRQRAVTAVAPRLRTSLTNGSGPSPPSPLAQSTRPDSIDGDSPLDDSTSGLQRVRTAPGITQPTHDEDGYEDSADGDDVDEVGHDEYVQASENKIS